MPGIRITLTEAATNTTRSVELPRDAPMSRLIPALIARLQLPIIGPDGQPMSYRLQSAEGTQLRESDTLNATGMQEGASIVLTAEMEAG